MATESSKVEFVFPQYLRSQDEHKEIRVVPQSLMEIVECDDKENQLRYLVTQGLLDAVGYDYEEIVTKTVKDSVGRITKREEIIKKTRQPANQQLLTFFIVNLAKQVGSNEWVQKVLPTQDNRQLTLNIEGKIESERIAEFAQKFLQGNTEGNGSKPSISAAAS